MPPIYENPIENSVFVGKYNNYDIYIIDMFPNILLSFKFGNEKDNHLTIPLINNQNIITTLENFIKEL